MQEESMNQALTVLKQYFGYDEFRSPQDQIINTVMQKQDALVVMPTGGGKSLCYQLPALMLQGCTVVISPLIALMQDQVDGLEQLGINAAFLNSSQSPEQAGQVMQRLQSGQLSLLYVAPERLLMPQTLQLLHSLNICLFAVDEAHCVSQWGHDFRSDYLQLNVLTQQFSGVPVIALTATADQRTRDEIIKRLGLRQAAIYLAGFDRPNIQYRISQKQNPNQQLLRFIRQEHHEHSGIVYCLSRKKTEAVAEFLSGHDYQALPYHAGLSTEQRAQHQRRFLREDKIIIVATIAFGMGIDKPDVRFVAHLDLPKSVEAYYQETGRAGRDGMDATAWMVYGLQDIVKLRQMLDNSDGSEEHKRVERHKLNAMLGLCEINSCRRNALLAYFDQDSPLRCENCDACLQPMASWDGTDAVRKALSCVYRTGQRFGVNHVIDVLIGKTTAKITQFNHDQISTFGIGSELDAATWRSVFRQLVARSFLNVDVQGFGALRLDPSCRPLLKGEQTIELRRDHVASKTGSGSKKSRQVAQEDEGLWQALRETRMRFAKDQGVPPYVIFHDATLMEMLQYQPQNEQQMLNLSGVGSSKMERYGDAFIDTIAEFVRGPSQISESQSEHECFALASAGMGAQQIAQQLGLHLDVCYSYLAEHIKKGSLSLDQIVDVDAQVLAEIEEQFFALEDLNQDVDLQRIDSQLQSQQGQGLLRCVLYSLLREM